MRRFVFNLQKVLDHRMRIEDAKKHEFVKSRLIYLKEKEKLTTLEGKLDDLVSGSPSGNNTFSYIARYNYMLLLEERIDDQKRAVGVREGEMNEKKLEFEISQKDRKVLDKLKEKAHIEYNFNMDKLEQKQNDEFALYGYVRKYFQGQFS
jgi:flagellar FliJ protein